MAVKTAIITISTAGNTDIINITDEVNSEIRKSGASSGIANIFVPGSTAGISTIEYEPGLIKDLKLLFQRIAPSGETYAHDQTWHDGNGYSHLRSTLLGPSLTVPFAEKALILGTWQQIILIDFDNRKRERKIIIQMLGD